jgi:elongation factor Tu
VRTSALGVLQGEAEWEKVIDDLIGILESRVQARPKPADEPFAMPVADCRWQPNCQPKVMGQIARGRCRVGDAVEVVGSRETWKTVIAGLSIFHESVEKAESGIASGFYCGTSATSLAARS